MTTHKPATALPPVSFDLNSCDIGTADWRTRKNPANGVSTPSKRLDIDEKVELCRRANAYSKLVAHALKAQELRFKLLAHYGSVPECVLEYCNENRALRRELGEAP
jgi:hypothetical protein